MPLHPKARWFLDQLETQGRPGWHEMPVETGRALFASSTALFGEGPRLASVEDRVLDGVPARFYRPSKRSRLPAMMYFHGGGWVIGSVDTHDALCRRLSKASDRVVISVDYRLAPEHKYPAALIDCFVATKHVFQNAQDFNLDRDDLVLAGDSAGGNLAAGVSLKARDEGGPAIRGQVLIYPVVETNFETQSYLELATGHGLTRTTMQWFWEQYLPDPSLDAKYARLGSVDLTGSPPTHVLTAEYDVLRDEGEQFAERMQATGVATTCRRYDGMLHGFVHLGGIFDDGLAAVNDIAKVVQRLSAR